jgi:hypothetical protein
VGGGAPRRKNGPRFNPQIEGLYSPICDLSQTTYPIAQRRTNTQTQLRRQSASHTQDTHRQTVTERVIEKPSGQYSLRGCDEGGNWQKEGGEGGATTPNPNPNPNRGRGLSLARLECGQRQSRCSGALPLAAPAPLRIELRLLDFQNRRGEARISILVVRTCSHFRRAPPHEEPFCAERHPAPRSGRKK